MSDPKLIQYHELTIRKYHCHTDYCYPDGYRAPFIVHDSDAWFADQYKEEFAVTVSDWYHNMVEDIRFIDLAKYV